MKNSWLWIITLNSNGLCILSIHFIKFINDFLSNHAYRSTTVKNTRNHNVFCRVTMVYTIRTNNIGSFQDGYFTQLLSLNSTLLSSHYTFTPLKSHAQTFQPLLQVYFCQVVNPPRRQNCDFRNKILLQYIMPIPALNHKQQTMKAVLNY